MKTVLSRSSSSILCTARLSPLPLPFPCPFLPLLPAGLPPAAAEDEEEVGEEEEEAWVAAVAAAVAATDAVREEVVAGDGADEDAPHQLSDGSD